MGKIMAYRTDEKKVAYMDWRYKRVKSQYAADIDQVEYRMENGVPIPVAVIELKYDGCNTFGRTQVGLNNAVAASLGVPAFAVWYTAPIGTKPFRVTGLNEKGRALVADNTWMQPGKYKEFLKSL